MAESSYWTADACILRRARVHVSGLENVKNALTEIDADPLSRYKFNERVKEYDTACASLNRVLRDGNPDPRMFGNVIAMRDRILQTRKFDAIQIPTLAELASFVRSGKITRTIDPNVPLRFFRTAVKRTYEDASDNVKANLWKFGNEARDVGLLTSAFIVEGCGLLIANALGDRARYDDELARLFVLGFEEVLFRMHPESNLLIDVLGWMIEERSDFSEGLQRDLELLAKTPRTFQEQLGSLPAESKCQKILRSLHYAVRRALHEAGIEFEIIGARVKTDENIHQKVERKIALGNHAPLLDIYGLRCVLNEQDKVPAAEAVQTALPTPHVTRNGILTRRDFERTIPNPQQPGELMTVYRAYHVNVFLPHEQIGEVQLTTRQDDETARIFRENYRRIKGKEV